MFSEYRSVHINQLQAYRTTYNHNDEGMGTVADSFNMIWDAIAGRSTLYSEWLVVGVEVNSSQVKSSPTQLVRTCWD